MNYKNADGTWTTIGIVSYDHYLRGCRNDSSTPRPFVRISSYVDWICNITKDCPLTTLRPSSTQSESTSTASPITTLQPKTKENSTSSAPTTPAPIGLCGRANGEGANPKIPDIQSMAYSEFPWLAFIYFGDSFKNKMWCSGSIISPKWIMTAASCMDEHRYYIHLFSVLFVNESLII